MWLKQIKTTIKTTHVGISFYHLFMGMTGGWFMAFFLPHYWHVHKVESGTFAKAVFSAMVPHPQNLQTSKKTVATVEKKQELWLLHTSHFWD